MNKHLQSLIQIANLDKQIDDLEPKIAQARKELDSKIAQKTSTLRAIGALQDQNKNLQHEINENDRLIHETSARLESIAKKQQEVRNEKELRALSVEEDIAKENLTLANEQIQKLQTIQKARNDEIAQLQGSISELDSQISELEQSTQSAVAVIKQEQQEIFKQKQEIIAKSDIKSITFYEKIRRWAKNTSVVPVFKQACGGCFIRLNDRTYAEVLSDENSIVTCPHCGRILYPSNKQSYKECVQ
ncbi:zinc ribbon domain-containing protein [uncultured Helicobacter sp.]|uniref:zinc ribbon domain-containing protein n=1 Tax=uncultured Helicobacter sp. TaxID=175537 RepID=UPI001C3ABA76|nr:zinc ribbon domain-containing protein [Candidatus Helicobacter avicola]